MRIVTNGLRDSKRVIVLPALVTQASADDSLQLRLGYPVYYF